MLVSVDVPFTTEQRISTRSPVCTVATFVASDAGTAQVTPATLIEVADTAVTAPSAEFVSGGCFGAGFAQWPLTSSTAEPPAVPPPIFPFVNPPVTLNVAEMFASSWACDMPWPVAVPTMVPLAYTAEYCAFALPTLSVPLTTPMPSVESMVLRAVSVAAPVRSLGPVAVPVYVAFVDAIVFPVVVVQEWVLVFETVVAVNVPETE